MAVKAARRYVTRKISSVAVLPTSYAPSSLEGVFSEVRLVAACLWWRT